MKKIFSVMLATVLVLTIGVAAAFAASETYAEEFTNSNKSAGVRRAYRAVDADGDGVCDNCQNGGVRPLDGTGKQNGKGGANRGAGFVDADGDGVCDNCQNGGVRPLDGTGKQNGKGGANRGAAFVDSDGDGVCDNANGAAAFRAGTGNRGGRGMGVKIAK